VAAMPVEHGDLMASLDWLVAGLADRGSRPGE
jgi:hypothetical protein